jgi:hypothetical protein
MAKQKKLGIIQSRGLGDIVIALPIARYYHNEGYQVHWPICEEFLPSVQNTVPWVKWIPIQPDSGAFFYDVPMQRLQNFKCDEIICLYQALTGHPEFHQRPEFQITGFDQLKYHVSQVPFINKWRLDECITRDHDREELLYQRVTNNQPYVVVHTEGSDHKARIDPSWIPEGWQIVEVTPLTNNVFDWLYTLENAEAIITVDSVIANIVDQLAINVNVDSYFIPRSHIHLTPVLGNPWTVLDPGADVLKRISIFK